MYGGGERWLFFGVWGGDERERDGWRGGSVEEGWGGGLAVVLGLSGLFCRGWYRWGWYDRWRRVRVNPNPKVGGGGGGVGVGRIGMIVRSSLCTDT